MMAKEVNEVHGTMRSAEGHPTLDLGPFKSRATKVFMTQWPANKRAIAKLVKDFGREFGEEWENDPWELKLWTLTLWAGLVIEGRFYEVGEPILLPTPENLEVHEDLKYMSRRLKAIRRALKRELKEQSPPWKDRIEGFAVVEENEL